MKKKILFLIIGTLLLSIPSVLAEDITLSIDQKDYYFLVGEEAIINLRSENTHKEPINGMLSYTITQAINQGNYQYSSSNTKSISLSLGKGESELPISFGTSDSPMSVAVDLKFSYSYDDEQKEVNLNDIKINFVSKQSGKNNQQNPLKGSSQKAHRQRDPFSRQEQKMQQMINRMFGNQQQAQQTAQQSLQNNQMSQDSSALKQQMQKQIQQHQQMNEKFQKQLAQNQEFQKEHQALLHQGYSISSADLNPSSEKSGNFEINYQNQNGQQASLSGKMQNGKITSLQKDTPEERQKLLDQLNKNKDFQRYKQELEKYGYRQQRTEFSNRKNKTIAKLNYNNQNNKTATIRAEFFNNTVQKVTLEKESMIKNYWWALPLLFVLLITNYLLYKKYFINAKKALSEKKIIIEEESFDYISASKKMLEEAENLFSQKKYKDSYGKSGQALRLYLSYKYGLKKELTNDEIIKYLRKHNKSYKEIKECFDLCSLVEFAKYEASNRDFNQIVHIIKKNVK